MSILNEDNKMPTFFTYDAVLNDISLIKYIVTPLPKVIDTRGFLYLVEDKLYPEYIKIGQTYDVHKRLRSYNGDRPFPTVRILAVTKEFKNSRDVETKILANIYQSINPSTNKKEWFEIKHKDLLIKLLTEAEKQFD